MIDVYMSRKRDIAAARWFHATSITLGSMRTTGVSVITAG